MKPKAPCRDCEKRTITCHGFCEEYKQFRKDQDEYMQNVYKVKGRNTMSEAMWKIVRLKELGKR